MSILFSLVKDIFASKPSAETLSAVKNIDTLTQQQNSLNENIIRFRQILATRPNHVDSLYNLGLNILKREPDEALECFRRVVKLDPKHYAAKLSLLNQMLSRCEWNDQQVNIVRELKNAICQTSVSSRNIMDPFMLFSLPGVTAHEQMLCAKRWFNNVGSTEAKDNFEAPMPNKKIRLAYLSGDFHQHAVAFQIADLFARHDRKRFHVTAYSYGPDDGSGMRKRLVKAFDKFCDIRDDSNEVAAQKIFDDHIDILIDLTGHTGISRSRILALRPAPIQVNYLGYAGTMGADFVDYMIADRFTIPQEQRQYYSEKVVWLPDSFMPTDSTRRRLPAPARKDCGLPADGFVFCCFNQAYKITPEVFDIWCRLLKAVPDSVLWLPESQAHTENNLRREALKRGADPERIIMAPKLVQIESHLARLQCADLFLDTLPYNAHATCCDALWMGLPVVTCAGDTFSSRVAGSLLNAIGVPELIAYNLDDYYRLALDLACDRNKLVAIRNKIIANRDTAPLFDSQRFTRNLEKVYIQMMADYAEPSLNTH